MGLVKGKNLTQNVGRETSSRTENRITVLWDVMPYVVSTLMS